MSFFTVKRLRLYFGGLLLLQLSLFVRAIPFAMNGSLDYRTFYAAGVMSRTGAGKLLYDYASETQIQNAVVSPSENALPFMSPACTSLFFAPLTRVRYKVSYFLFLALNAAIITVALFTVWKHLHPLAGMWYPLPILLFYTFLPVGVSLVQGQVSLLLLLIVCGSFSLLQQDRQFIAGLLLSAGLIKFQIILPVALLFLLWNRFRFVLGFATGAFALAMLSVRLTGIAVQHQYLHSLVSTSGDLSDVANQVRYGLYPSRMPNIFGLIHAISTPAIPAVTALASLGLFIWAAFQRASLPLAVLVGLSVSYHLYLHDLSLLLLPIGLILSDAARNSLSTPDPWRKQDALGRRPTAQATCLFLLLAPLERLLIASDRIYLLALPVLLLTITLGTVGQAPSDRPTKTLTSSRRRESLA